MAELTTEQQKQLDVAEHYLNGAKNFIIDNQEMYLKAAHRLKEIKAKKLEYDVMRKKLKAPILQAAKNIEDLFRKPITFLTEAEQAYKKSMVRYHDEQEKKILQAAIENRRKQEELADKAMTALDNGDAETYNELANNIITLAEVDYNTGKINGIHYRDNCF